MSRVSIRVTLRYSAAAERQRRVECSTDIIATGCAESAPYRVREGVPPRPLRPKHEHDGHTASAQEQSPYRSILLHSHAQVHTYPQNPMPFHAHEPKFSHSMPGPHPPRTALAEGAGEASGCEDIVRRRVGQTMHHATCNKQTMHHATNKLCHATDKPCHAQMGHWREASS